MRSDRFKQNNKKLYIIHALDASDEGYEGNDYDYDFDNKGSKENIVAVMQALFNPASYDKRVRPVDTEQEVLTVSLQLQLKSMFDVDENDQTMTTMCLVMMSWQDQFLKWVDTGVLKSVNMIQVKQEDIWVPDITIGNIVQADWHMGDKRQTLSISQTGQVTWNVNALIVTECEIVVTFYPFDTQVCTLEFTTEQSPGSSIKIVNFNELNNVSALNLYGEDGTWSMLGYTIEASESEDNLDRPITQFSFYLSRRHSFYLVSFIGPVVFLSLTSCLVFLIPAEAGEKMGTAITVLLAFAVYLTIVTEYLPDTSLQVSFLALYLTMLLGLTTFSVVLTSFILNVYHRDTEDNPVGPKVRRLTRFLQKITCNRPAAEKKNEEKKKKKVKKSADEKRKRADSNISWTNFDAPRRINLHSIAYIDAPKQRQRHPDNYHNQDYDNNDDIEEGSRESDVTEDVEADHQNMDWKTVSKTLDWFCYLTFSFIVLSTTIAYLSAMVYEGVYNISSYNETGQLRPFSGRDAGGF